MATQRRDLIEHCKLCDSAKRYDEMIEVMDKIIAAVPKNQGLSAEERKLLSIAYKNSLAPKRRSWKSLEGVERSRDLTVTHKNLVKDYRNSIGDEIKALCLRLIETLDKKLIPTVTEPESDIFYHKLRGDYYRYMAEVESDTTNVPDYVNKIQENYQGATDYSDKSLAASHPLCLQLAMNYSVFMFDMLGNTEQAKDHAKKHYDAALDEIESVREVDEDRYNECVGLLRLIHENIKVWSPQMSTAKRSPQQVNSTTMFTDKSTNRAF